VLSSSPVLLDKIVPQEVMVGAPYRVEYIIRNTSDTAIGDVILTDEVGPNFRRGDSMPVASSVDGNTATWVIEEIPAGGSRAIVVSASSPQEGIVTTCSSLTYMPVYCESIRVVKADLQLAMSLTPQVILCDPVIGRLVVTNTGSSRLTGVVVSSNLPQGLQTADGRSQVRLDAGDLNPGESRSFDLSLKAARTGEYTASATATSVQGIEASDTASTVARAPMLVIDCDAPDERFLGRPATVCFTVANTGDAASINTELTMPVPAGAIFQGATGGGRLVDNNVVWSLGSLAANADREVCATFTGSTATTLVFTGTVTGECADRATSTCRITITGIPAILLEVVDLEDPIPVGRNVVYEIVATNQGSAPATNVRIVATLEESQEYVSSTGVTQARVSGKRIEFNPVPVIAPGAKAVWEVTVKAVEPDDVRFTVEMTSDQLGRKVMETEATFQY